MKGKNLGKKIGKTLLAGVVGAIIGIPVFIFYFFKIWVPMNSSEIGLGIIALVPVMIILFSIVGIFIGGISGMIIYWIVKLTKKNRRKNLL
jgi:hypothetical protein